MASEPTLAFRAAVLAVLGNAPEVIEPGRWQRFSTGSKVADDAGWCKLFDDQRAGVFGCHRQGVRETWTAADPGAMSLARRASLARQVLAATAERQAKQQQRWAENAQRIAQLWAQCVPLTRGDAVVRYITARGISAWPLPTVLRCHAAMPYLHAGKKLGVFPAMVAPVMSPDGRLVALHRTYLTSNGRKADVPSPKKLTGSAGRLAGACIPLHEPAAGSIGIAEGIETALAAWCASGVPTVASYCAGNLAAWQWPAGLRRLVIFADADAAGRQAAAELQDRARAVRMRVDLMMPTDPGADWCDVWAVRDAVWLESVGAT